MNILQQGNGQPGRQLQHEVVQRCREQLKRHAERRHSIDGLDAWKAMRTALLEVIAAAFPPMVTERKRALSSRLVSRYEMDDYRVENVIFESFPGWEVNGSVYLPKEKGRYPAVVCPTGHSSKTRESYQTAAQVFARNGFAAISFDPPGCVGEIQHLNDHFTNGLIGYLTGIWSNFHFVYDALCCIDYMETRHDVDCSPGVTMTGVSGGGVTSIYASLFDDRIRFVAPACCLAEHESIHLTDLYTSCPKQFGPGFIREGIDFADLVALQAPKACLIMGGKLDDLFDYRSTERLHRDAAAIYRLYDEETELGLYLQPDAGHEYSAEMAGEVVRWMNRLIKGNGQPPLPLRATDLQLLEPEQLLCHPSNEVNMFTMNRAEGRKLEAARAEGGSGVGWKEHLARLLSLETPMVSSPSPGYSVREETWPPVRGHQFQSVVLQSSRGQVDVQIPGLLFRRIRSDWVPVASGRRPALLHIDESGKWNGFRQDGVLPRIARYMERTGLDDEPMVFSIDVSGCGELQPQPVPYDVASWNDIERILTYLSIASGWPIMGLQVRDALTALHYLRSRSDVDPQRLTIAGRGSGAIVALLAAAFAGEFHKLILWDGLARYQELTESFPFAWPQSIIIPDLLRYTDLPEVLQAVNSEDKILLNPRDANRDVIDLRKARQLYPGNSIISTQLDEQKAIDTFVSWAAGDP